VLNSTDAELARAYWGVTEEGNFEESNILYLPMSREEFISRSAQEPADMIDDIERVRSLLLQERSKRIAPGIDDKILTSWNALMLKAFAEAGAVFENPQWIAVAEKNARLLFDQLRDGENRLLHTWKATGSTTGDARILGYLDDHAYLIDSLLTLYESTFDYTYIDEAQTLANQMIERFWDPDWEVFYDTTLEHSKLLVRPRDVLDNAVPSGGSIAAMALLRLSIFTGNSEYSEKAEASMRALIPHMEQAPSAVTSWLSAVDFLRSTVQEVVLIGAQSDPVITEMKRELLKNFTPNTVIAGASEEPGEAENSPLLQGRVQVDGKGTAYVCENYACKLPVTTVAGLVEQLG
jgi:hypothetical protein